MTKKLTTILSAIAIAGTVLSAPIKNTKAEELTSKLNYQLQPINIEEPYVPGKPLNITIYGDSSLEKKNLPLISNVQIIPPGYEEDQFKQIRLTFDSVLGDKRLWDRLFNN